MKSSYPLCNASPLLRLPFATPGEAIKDGCATEDPTGHQPIVFEQEIAAWELDFSPSRHDDIKDWKLETHGGFFRFGGSLNRSIMFLADKVNRQDAKSAKRRNVRDEAP